MCAHIDRNLFYPSYLYPSYLSLLYPSYLSLLYPSYLSLLYPSYLSLLYPSYLSLLYSSATPLIYPSSIPLIYPSATPLIYPSSTPLIYPSMQGLGTDDATLIRVMVSRCEVDMVQIKKCFYTRYHKTLGSFIKVGSNCLPFMRGGGRIWSHVHTKVTSYIHYYWPHEVDPWFHSWYRGRAETLDATHN